jgi:predicted ferric reductase
LDAIAGRTGAPAIARPPSFSVAMAWLAFLVNAALVTAFWIRHGGIVYASASPASLLMGIGQITALLGTYLALAGLLLISRMPMIEQLLGDDAVRFHRLAGIGTIALLTAHVVFSVAGYALMAGVPFPDEFISVVLTYPYMLAGFVAFLMFAGIGASSIRFVRSHLSYETWSGLHLYAYLAMILGLGHQLAVGTDFAMHPLARAYWVALYVGVFGQIAIYRICEPVLMLAAHRFRVERVVRETPDIVSIYVTGRGLAGVPVRAGQYFRLRLLARNEWWRSHPFSISAAPDGHTLRFTVKALGDFSTRLQELRPGTRVMLEGPSGALTAAARTRKTVLLVGGGIGITPVRALFEELAGKVDVRLIYRASSLEEVIFSDEINRLALRPGAAVTYLVGRRGQAGMPADPLGPDAILALVPDIAARDVFVCGPTPMMDAVERSLEHLGLPRRQIHSERFAA